MAVQFVPVALAAGVIRMVAPTVARALIKSGMGRKATQAAINKAGKNIPRVTRNEAEQIAKQANEAKKLKNLDRAQRLDKQPTGEKPYQTLSRAEKQEKAADSARSKLTPRQEAERLKRLNQQQSINVMQEVIKSSDHFFSNHENKVVEKVKSYFKKIN